MNGIQSDAVYFTTSCSECPQINHCEPIPRQDSFCSLDESVIIFHMDDLFFWFVSFTDKVYLQQPVFIQVVFLNSIIQNHHKMAMEAFHRGLAVVMLFVLLIDPMLVIQPG
ncbi:hypothetical protein SDC9_182887 [bioreactor metagenome]|uniref:Uncharacterized protein n=1 Tax=bioreactor metagenome TaxID=1076179 RepID=A0A645HB84_9ZZZZ